MTALWLASSLAQVQAGGGQWWLSLPAQVAGVLGGLAGLAALVTGFANRRKIDAEGGKLDAEKLRIINDAAIEMLAPSREQVAFLRAEMVKAREEHQQQMAATRRQLEETQVEVLILKAQVASLTKDLRSAQREHGGR